MKTAVIVDSVRTGLAKSHRGGFNITRADDMLAVRKAEVVPQIFNDPEMQAMGLEDAPEAEEPEDEATNEDV